MADEGTFATTAEILRKAGLHANSTATAEAYTNDFIKQAESFINTATRNNWTDEYSGLNDDVKYILKEAASNLAAIYCILYDFNGYLSKSYAMDRVEILYQRAQDCIKILQDKKREDFVTKA